MFICYTTPVIIIIIIIIITITTTTITYPYPYPSPSFYQVQQASSVASRDLEIDLKALASLTHELTGLREQLAQARQGLDQRQVTPLGLSHSQ